MTSKRNDIIERYRVLPGQIQSIDKDVKNTWKLEVELVGDGGGWYHARISRP